LGTQHLEHSTVTGSGLRQTCLQERVPDAAFIKKRADDQRTKIAPSLTTLPASFHRADIGGPPPTISSMASIFVTPNASRLYQTGNRRGKRLNISPLVVHDYALISS
jgi:hypothetical protein